MVADDELDGTAGVAVAWGTDIAPESSSTTVRTPVASSSQYYRGAIVIRTYGPHKNL